MKKLMIILLAVAISLPSFAQKTVREGLDQLEKRYGVHFVYDSTLPLDSAYGGKALDSRGFRTNLRRLLQGTGLDFEIHNRQVVLKRLPSAVKISPEQMASLSEVQLLDSAKVVDWREQMMDVPAPGSIGLSRLAVLQAPVLFGEKDVLKTLQMLPGVQAASEGFSGISVRGGYADENLILLDGVPVYNADHLLGLFSVFPAESVGGVTLYKGNFPACYGGRTSSVVSVTSAEGNGTALRGSVTAGLLASKLHLDGPIDSLTRFSFSGRVLHTMLAEPLLLCLDSSSNLWFYDLSGRLDRDLSPSDKLSLTVYNGCDLYRDDRKGAEFQREYDRNFAPLDKYIYTDNHYLYAWGNTLAALRWTHSKELNVALAYSRYGIRDMRAGTVDTDLEGDLHSSTTATRAASVLRDVHLSAGYKTENLDLGAHYTLHLFSPGGRTRHISETENGASVTDSLFWLVRPEAAVSHEAAVWGEGIIGIGDRLSLHPGLRLSLFHSFGKTWFIPEPRFSVRWAPSEAWLAEAGYTRMSQCMHRIPSLFSIMPGDEWRPISASLPPMTSDQLSASLRYSGIEGWDFSAEAYYKSLNGVTEYRNSYSTLGSSYAMWSSIVASGKGRAWGTELLARKTSGRLTGWLGYTLSWADRQFADGSVGGGRRFPASTDRRHRINLCLTYNFNEHTDLTAAWTFASGAPMTVPSHYVRIFSEPSQNYYKEYRDVLYASAAGGWRLPPVHRADVSVNFRKPLHRGDRVWSFGIYNLYGSRNGEIYYLTATHSYSSPGVPGYSTSYPDGTPAVMRNSVLMFLPTVSYTRNF